MSQLTPQMLRPHLGILDAGDVVEDALLQSFIDAAWAYCCNYTRRDLNQDYADGVPADLAQAQIMLAAHYFLNREAVTDADASEVPLGVRDLLAPYRSLS